jgi:hypothetical protein
MPRRRMPKRPAWHESALYPIDPWHGGERHAGQDGELHGWTDDEDNRCVLLRRDRVRNADMEARGRAWSRWECGNELVAA